MVRINIGQLALMPGATLDDALGFADELARMMPKADIVVVSNGRRHEVFDGTADERTEAARLIDQISEAWKLATDRPTIKCPVAAEVAS